MLGVYSFFWGTWQSRWEPEGPFSFRDKRVQEEKLQGYALKAKESTASPCL